MEQLYVTDFDAWAELWPKVLSVPARMDRDYGFG
jgi:hypothetical protein